MLSEFPFCETANNPLLAKLAKRMTRRTESAMMIDLGVVMELLPCNEFAKYRVCTEAPIAAGFFAVNSQIYILECDFRTVKNHSVFQGFEII